MVHVVERHDFLIEFEEMDFVGAYLVDCDVLLLGLRSVQHSDSSLREVVGHGELGVPVEANVVLVLTALLVLCIVRIHSVDVALEATVVAIGSASSISVSMGV